MTVGVVKGVLASGYRSGQNSKLYKKPCWHSYSSMARCNFGPQTFHLSPSSVPSFFARAFKPGTGARAGSFASALSHRAIEPLSWDRQAKPFIRVITSREVFIFFWILSPWQLQIWTEASSSTPPACTELSAAVIAFEFVTIFSKRDRERGDHPGESKRGLDLALSVWRDLNGFPKCILVMHWQFFSVQLDFHTNFLLLGVLQSLYHLYLY